MDLPTLYTPAQIADYLHVSRGTIYSLLHRRQIDSVKVGRNRRFTAEHVKRLVSIVAGNEQIDALAAVQPKRGCGEMLAARSSGERSVDWN